MYTEKIVFLSYFGFWFSSLLDASQINVYSCSLWAMLAERMIDDWVNNLFQSQLSFGLLWILYVWIQLSFFFLSILDMLARNWATCESFEAAGLTLPTLTFIYFVSLKTEGRLRMSQSGYHFYHNSCLLGHWYGFCYLIDKLNFVSRYIFALRCLLYVPLISSRRPPPLLKLLWFHYL